MSKQHTALDLRTLDQTRQRLQQLHNAISSLQRELTINDPLPSWSALQNSFLLISRQLRSMSQHMATHNDELFQTAHVYPLPSFPQWFDKQGLLFDLLRAKTAPDVAEWVEQGHDASVHGKQGVGDVEQLGAVWDWASGRAQEIAAQVPWGIDFTVEEKEMGAEGVVTGIRRKLNDGVESDEEDEDEDDDEDGDGDGDEDKDEDGDVGMGESAAEMQPSASSVKATPMLPLEDVLRFVNSGVLPRGVT